MPAAAGADALPLSMVSLSNSRRWSIVLLLFVASTINYFDRATLSFALPQISTSLGLQPAAKGVLLSAFFWSYALMQVPMGLLADRFNLRWIYAGAFALWSFAQGLTGFATTLTMLIGFRIILGIGEAIYLPGGTKTVSLLVSAVGTGLALWTIRLRHAHGSYPGRGPGPMDASSGMAGARPSRVIGFSALVWLIPWLLVTPRDMRAPARTEPALFGLG